LVALSLPDLTVVYRLDKGQGHADAIASLALSPDGMLLATAGKDRRVMLRDAVTFKALLTFPDWTAPLQDVAFDAAGRWLAYGGVDSEIGLWDLRLVHDELAAVGLAWDQSASQVAATETLASATRLPRSPVPIIRPGNIDPAEFEKARGLVNSGVAAFRQGRYADATVDLEQASERLQALRRPWPTDTTLASQHGISLGFLGGALKELKRPGEALKRYREALALYDSMNALQTLDRYNMACDCAMLSVLDEKLLPAEREKLEVRAVASLRKAIEEDRAQYPALIAEDPDLDALRNRADFCDLIADAGFPRDPFVPPSPLSGSVPETFGTKDANASLARKNEGHELQAAGRTLDGISVLASAWASNPDDTLLLVEVAGLQAWFGKDAELAVTCRRALEVARDTSDPATADRTAKICCLRPSNDKTRCAAALALAKRAVKLGMDNQWLPYFRMAVGMAEYRSGNYAAADEALIAAERASEGHVHICGTSAFYHAMSLFRQGKEVDARRIAIEAALQMKPVPTDDTNPLTGGAVADDLILWMAYKEAKGLLKLDPAPASRSKRDGQ
jgi:tetratricopeptide (TPR) repeat protein